MARLSDPGTVRVVRKPVGRKVPAPRSAVFGPLGGVGPGQAQRQAAKRTAAARQPILRRTSVPYVPKLPAPTRSQRNAQIRTVGLGLKAQGVTDAEVQALARGEGGRAKQVAVNDYLGRNETQTRKLLAGVGRNAGHRGTETELARHGARIVAQTIAQARPGDQHTRLGLPGATIDLTKLQHGVGAALANNPASAFAKGISTIASVRPFSEKGVLGRTANDALTFPAAAIPTAYNTLATALSKGPVAGARTITDPLVHTVEHPVSSFEQHPLFVALLAHGGIAAAGRTAGAVARSGALGEAARGAASISRPSLAVAGESGARIVLPRRYSRSVVHKAAQVSYDRRLAPVRDERGNVVKDARGRPLLAAPAGGRFNKGERLLTKRADFMASRANAVERNTRAQVSRDVHAAQPARQHRVTGRAGQAVDRARSAQPSSAARVLPLRGYRIEKDLVPMAIEGTIRPGHLAADLQKERARLEVAYQSRELDPVQRRTNRTRARTIDRALKDPRALANEPAIFASARTLAERGNRLAAEAVAQRMLDPAAAERAKLFPYAQSHMGAGPVAHADGSVTLRAGDGTFLSNEQIRAHMADPATGPVVNPDHIAYLPHRLDTRGARSFHQQFRLQRRNLDQESRTGTAYAQGATASDASLPLEHLTRMSGLLANVREFDRLIHDVGIKHPDGRYFTWKEAQQYASRAGHATDATGKRLPGEAALVPVRAHAAKYDEARARGIQNEQDPGLPGASGKLVHDQTGRFLGPDAGDPNARNVVLVPQTIAERLQENLTAGRKGDRPFQAYTRAFRTTVLPFSTKWLAGNVAEAVLRLAAAGVNPRDANVGRRLIGELHKIDVNAAEQIHAHLIGGLLYGEKGLSNRRGAEAFGPVAGAVARAPVVKELGMTIRGITKPIFALNKALEQGSQYAALGKYARREIHDFSGSWAKSIVAQRQALRDVAKGLTDTAAQQDAARFLDETLGQYSRFSPTMRHTIQTYAPFVPWYLNSMRFVLWTLPAHHPIKTAALTQAETAFQKDWEDQHKGLPAGLKTSVPSHGGFIDLARYTPFGGPGPLAAGDLGSAEGIVLPQISGVQAALLGNDPFGRPLKVAPSAGNPRGQVTPTQQLGIVANQIVEGIVPGVGLTRRLREHGRTAYADSNAISPKTKPPKAGTPTVSAANRVFNPIRPTYISASRTTSSGAAPVGVSSAELEAIKRQAKQQTSKLPPGVSQAELDAIKRQAAAH